MPTNLPFWRDPAQQAIEPNYFNEAPNVALNRSTSVFSSSIDTADIDMYRQGVEITQQKYFDKGTAKISAGEAGHVLARNRFGEDKTWDTTSPFQDLDYFNPVTFLRAQSATSPLLVNLITFPIITSDNNQIDNYNLDGVIEPLTIRAAASFFSVDVPFESHAVKGSVMGGNVDSRSSTEQVLTVDYFSLRHTVPFLDLIDMFGTLSTVGFFLDNNQPRDPFADTRFVGNVQHSASIGVDMLEAMSLMTGSTSNYVSLKKRSATSGWTFDNVAGVGTDSIAFGGRAH